MFTQPLVFAILATSVLATPVRRIDIHCPILNKASKPFNSSEPATPINGSDTTGFCVYGGEAPCNYELNHGLPTNTSDPKDCPFAISNSNTLPALAGCPFVNSVNAPLLQGFRSNIGTTVCTYATENIEFNALCTYGTSNTTFIPAFSGGNCSHTLPPVFKS
ncbi:hypothetical protein C8R47DRAFT_1169571 [Mycena vitilis]|nr:hypothetical protein C8R47DRAFT_1169571 [Mycena vitilis]